MSASFTQSGNATSESTFGRKVARFAPYGLSPILLLVALLGAGWLYVPANPAIQAPATTLGFDELHDLAASGVIPTTWVQQNYFGWLGWTLIVVVIALTVATAITNHRIVASALAATGLISLGLHIFAVKGALTWGAFMDQTPNLRVGAYCAVAGYVLALALGGLRAARTRT